MRVVFVLLINYVLLSTINLKSCLLFQKRNHFVNPDEVENFAKDLGKDSKSMSFSEKQEISSVLTKIKVLAEQGKDQKEIESAVSSDLMVLSGGLNEGNTSAVLNAVNTYSEQGNQVSHSQKDPHNQNICPSSFDFGNGTNFSSITGLHDSNNAQILLKKLPEKYFQCIPVFEMIQIAPVVINKFATNLKPMAIQLRKNAVSTYSDQKEELDQKAVEMEALFQKASNNFQIVQQLENTFLQEWSNRYAKSCANEISSTKETSINPYLSAYKDFESNLEKISKIIATQDNASNKMICSNILLQVDRLYKILNSNNCKNDVTSLKESYRKIFDKIDGTATLKKLSSGSLGYLTKKSDQLEKKIKNLEKEISELE